MKPIHKKIIDLLAAGGKASRLSNGRWVYLSDQTRSSVKTLNEMVEAGLIHQMYSYSTRDAENPDSEYHMGAGETVDETYEYKCPTCRLNALGAVPSPHVPTLVLSDDTIGKSHHDLLAEALGKLAWIRVVPYHSVGESHPLVVYRMDKRKFTKEQNMFLHAFYMGVAMGELCSREKK